tara:strand:+ start:212 stop:433 length:222 start_codon:yes stop_codon:yes gene_type:complete
MGKSNKTFVEGKSVAVYSSTTAAPNIEMKYLNQDRDLRMRCLELAVQLKDSSFDASVESICNIADQFYEHLSK